MNYLKYFKESFENNISLYGKGYEDKLEYCILDYGSNDGFSEYIKENHKDLIECGLVNFYQMITKPEYFHITHSKNVVHKLAQGEFVINLDADNLLVRGSTEKIFKMIEDNRDDHLVLTHRRKLIRGRIGFYKDDFINLLGGYDERMGIYGVDDRDMFERSIASKFVEINIGKKYNNRIMNDVEDRYHSYNNIKTDEQRWQCKVDNNNIMRSSLENGIYKANQGKPWGVAKVIKNFKEEIEVK